MMGVGVTPSGEISGPNSAHRLMVSASGNGTAVGGVFAVGDDDCELLDPLPTTGMAVSPDGTRLARVTWVEGDSELSELVINDGSGLLSYRRLDGVIEPHSMICLGDEIHVVSTGNNSVVRMDDAGRTRHMWRPNGVSSHGDRWHLNSLTVVDGRVLVTAFGMFDSVRGWDRPGALDGAGVVLDLATGDVVLSGLSAPHDPTWTGDGWLVCNSLSGEVWRLDADGHQTDSVCLTGWTRGLCVDGDEVYVGISAHRRAAPVERARIAVLDGSTLKEIGRIDLPTRDVFAVLPYNEGLANGLRVGTNLGVERKLGTSAVVMAHPLDAADSVVRMELAGSTATSATVIVTNLAGAILSGFGKHPIRVGARWWDNQTGEWVEVSRIDLPAPLYPHCDVEICLDLPTLPPDGVSLRICVLQEMVRWFDEVNPEAAIEFLPVP